MGTKLVDRPRASQSHSTRVSYYSLSQQTSSDHNSDFPSHLLHSHLRPSAPYLVRRPTPPATSMQVVPRHSDPVRLEQVLYRINSDPVWSEQVPLTYSLEPVCSEFISIVFLRSRATGVHSGSSFRLRAVRTPSTSVWNSRVL